MHTIHARENGETERRIYLLPAWHDASCYTDRERAALGWAEALTQLSEAHTREVAYEALWSEFSREDQIKLTLLINIVNGYNCLAVGFSGWADPAAVRSAAEAAVAA
jgi:alkylhydroperoxidase family enzyme